MKNLFRFILAAVFIVPLLVSQSVALEIEAAVGVAQLNPVGQISYQGVALDLKNDLKYDKVQTFTGRVKLDLPLVLPNIYVTAVPMRFEEIGNKNISFRFGSTTFTPNVPFTSSLRLDHYDTTLFYGVPFLETVTNDMLRVQVGLNVRIIDFKASISQAQTGLNESKSLIVPVPMAYGYFQLSPIDKLKVCMDLKGIAYGSTRHYDVTLLAKWQLFQFFFFGGGYKYQNMKISQSDINTEFEFGGPVLELGFIF